jgi:copper chaperone NosL
LLLLGTLAIVLTACAGAANLDEPPEIYYGEDVCEECSMIISEPRFAAAYMTADAVGRRFDDIGGMGSYHAEHQEDVEAFWVHDYDTEAWLRADEAYYVHAKDIQTPMAFGVIAFGEAARAEAMAVESGGEVMTFNEVLALYGAQPHTHHQEE